MNMMVEKPEEEMRKVGGWGRGGGGVELYRCTDTTIKHLTGDLFEHEYDGAEQESGIRPYRTRPRAGTTFWAVVLNLSREVGNALKKRRVAVQLRVNKQQTPTL